uniref:Uncharacterized protein n=1 Tax=Arundo donax TaxID=35708 RepID=A0A0A9AIU4_ARUDO
MECSSRRSVQEPSLVWRGVVWGGV